MKQLLTLLYGEVVEGWSPQWPCHIDDLLLIHPVAPTLERVHAELVAYRGHEAFVRSRRMPACDFFVPGPPGFIVEYDEVQHFTEPREITLRLIPADYPIGFNRELWAQECKRVRARDNDPPYRDEQRAWYDVLRDLMPPAIGMAPTRRIMDATAAFCLIDTRNPAAIDEFRRMLIAV